MYLPPQSSNWCSYNGMYYTAIFFGGPAKKIKIKNEIKSIFPADY